LDKA
jgi:hypothetical protein